MADIQLKYLQDLEAAGGVAATDLMHVSQSGLDRSVTVSVLMRFMTDAFFPVGSVMLRSDAKNPNTMLPGTTWVRLAAGRNIRIAAENGSDVLNIGGADDVTLTGNNLPSHSHAFQNGSTNQAGNHTHNVWTGNAGSHTHGAYTDAQGNHAHRAWTDAQGQHQHGVGIRNPSNYGGSGGYYGVRGIGLGSGAWAQGGGQTGSESLTSADGNHSHNVGMDAAGNHGHNITVNAVGDHAHAAAMDERGAHTHTVTGTIGSTGNNASFSVVNAYVNLAAWRRTQ